MKLQTWQKENNVKNNEIARLIGVDQSYITHILKGKRRPSPELALKIEQVTSGAVTRDELLFPELHK